MSNHYCKDCSYFMQHYALDRRRIFRVYCGHCTFWRPKHKKPDAKVCEHFTPGEKDEEQFASEEYLSKELLDYVLSLELLPEIEESKVEAGTAHRQKKL